MAMKDKPKTLTPKLRFPEFKDGPGWSIRPLGDMASCFHHSPARRRNTVDVGVC